MSLLWPSISSHRVPQYRNGARGSVVRVHCVSSMPHPQWHERRLAGWDGWGRKPKQLEHTHPSGFPLQREKCFAFVLLYRNNNNKNSELVTMLFPRSQISHIHRELLLSPAFIEPFISCPCFLPTSQWFRLFVLFGEIMMWYYQWEAERRLEYKTTDWADISSDHVCCCTPINKQYNMVNQWSDHPGLGFDFVLGENPTHPVICSFLDNSFPTEAHASLYFYGKLL